MMRDRLAAAIHTVTLDEEDDGFTGEYGWQFDGSREELADALIAHGVVVLAPGERVVSLADPSMSGQVLDPASLPKRVVVGANGAYWRDYGDGYSMCPTSTDNDPVEPAAVYRRLDEETLARALMSRYTNNAGESCRVALLYDDGGLFVPHDGVGLDSFASAILAALDGDEAS